MAETPQKNDDYWPDEETANAVDAWKEVIFPPESLLVLTNKIYKALREHEIQRDLERQLEKPVTVDSSAWTGRWKK